MSDNGAGECFIILVRHASRVVRWDKPEANHKIRNEQHYPRGTSDFETKGEPLTYALAGRLCDALKDLGKDLNTKVKDKNIICAQHLAARQTAKIYRDVVTDRCLFCGSEQDTNLDQGERWLTPNEENQETINAKAKAVAREICAAQERDANS